MIPAWPTLADGLTALFASLSGLPAGVGGPTDGPISFPPKADRGSFEFRIEAEGSAGVDELRRAYDPDAEVPGDVFVPPGAEDDSVRLGGFVDTLCGNRTVTIEFRVDCGRVRVGAKDRVAAVANKIRLPSSRLALRDLGLALASVGPVTDAVGGFDEHGRAVSAYVVEIFCNGAVETTDVPVTTIEQIQEKVFITGRATETE